MLSATLFVDADAGAGGNGLAWASAYEDLESALEHAATLNSDGVAENDISQIWIAEGTYKPSIELEPGDARSASFSLVDGVTLYGGFAGWETSVVRRNWIANRTVLSGDLGVTGNSADNAYTVVYCGLDVEASLNGVSITRGNANGTGGALHPEREQGGGIYNRGTLNVTNSTVIANAATHGGGIYSDSGVLNVTSCWVRSNWASASGGGIHGSGTVTVTNSDFIGNSAHFSWDGPETDGGGGIRFAGGTMTVTNSTFAENRGVGFYCDCADEPSTAQLNNTLFWRNVESEFDIRVPEIVDLSNVLSGSHNYFGFGCDQPCFWDGVDGNIIMDWRFRFDPALCTFLRDPCDGGNGWGDNPETPDIDESANDDYGDLRLGVIPGFPTEEFPAMDGGDNSLLPPDLFDVDNDGNTTETIPMDIDRWNRIRDDDADGAPTVNIGAYERSHAIPSGGIPGDLNEDGYVGSEDLDIVRANWGNDVFPGDFRAGDADGDGYVGAGDLDIVRAYWGTRDFKAAGVSSDTPPATESKQHLPSEARDSAFAEVRFLAEVQWRQAANAKKGNANKPSGPARQLSAPLYFSLYPEWE